MSDRLGVVRSDRYLHDLQAVHDFIEGDNLDAAMQLLLHIEDQVDSLSDPNFPRRQGRKPGTLELVVHRHYVVLLTQTATTVIAVNLLHVARQYP